jgi:hypothetical protein
MRYAYIENGSIKEGPKSLPKAWKNISGFNLQTNEQLRSFGWLPWRLVEVTSPGNDWIMTQPTIQITDTEIIETQTYRQKTQSEIEQEQNQITENNKAARAVAYKEESDPLFFKSQRGEATVEEWLAKVQEIRGRYPT